MVNGCRFITLYMSSIAYLYSLGAYARIISYRVDGDIHSEVEKQLFLESVGNAVALRVVSYARIV